MKKATWYYAKNRQDKFQQDAENLERCGVETVLFSSPDEPTTEAFLKAANGKNLQLHKEIALEDLHHVATGEPAPLAVTPRQEEWQAAFKGARPDWLRCWSPVKDVTPLCLWLQKYIREHSFVKGVSLDVVRYPNTFMQENYPCECAACQERRLPWLGRGTLTRDDLQDPTIMYVEIATKVDVISRIARELASAIHTCRVDFSIAARALYAGRDLEFNNLSTWGYGPAIYEGQDWVAWCREGLLDQIHFMNYSPQIERFERIARRHVALLAGARTVHHEGLGISSSAGKMSPDVLAREIGLCKDLGIAGVTLFSWAAMSEEHLQVLARA